MLKLLFLYPNYQNVRMSHCFDVKFIIWIEIEWWVMARNFDRNLFESCDFPKLLKNCQQTENVTGNSVLDIPDDIHTPICLKIVSFGPKGSQNGYNTSLCQLKIFRFQIKITVYTHIFFYEKDPSNKPMSYWKMAKNHERMIFWNWTPYISNMDALIWKFFPGIFVD